uniref:Uncharacterized protein n=1 Tax=Cacopsylla melanoneura TaxID=428564 RepID=A0A8D8XSM9_9HEMI
MLIRGIKQYQLNGYSVNKPLEGLLPYLFFLNRSFNIALKFEFFFFYVRKTFFSMFLTVISNFTSLDFSLVTISYISSLTISGTIFYNFSWFSYSFCLGVSVISKGFSSPTILKHLTFFFSAKFQRSFVQYQFRISFQNR